jgi:hypothetical protein
LWNDCEVLSAIQASGNVVAYIAGHDHDGKYLVDSAGIHHITPPAPLECAEEEEEMAAAYGRIEVGEDAEGKLTCALHWTGKGSEFLPVSIALPSGY